MSNRVKPKARGGGSRTYIVVRSVVRTVVCSVVGAVVCSVVCAVVRAVVVVVVVLLVVVLLLLVVVVVVVVLVPVITLVSVSLSRNRANGWEQDEEESGGVCELHREYGCVQCRSTAMLPTSKGQYWARITSKEVVKTHVNLGGFSLLVLRKKKCEQQPACGCYERKKEVRKKALLEKRRDGGGEGKGVREGES